MKKLLLTCLISFAGLNQAQNLLNGLQACYPLDGNANNYAATGSALNGTLVGVSSAVGHSGLANTAYSLSGTANSYIVLPDHSGLKNNNLFFTGWFKFSSLSWNQYMVYTKNTCSSYFEAYALNAYKNGPNNYVFVVTKSSNTCSYAPQMYSTTPINIGSWYHVGFFISNSSIKLYVNGHLEASTSHSTNFDYSAGKKVFIGLTNESYYNLASNMVVDNMRFYNRELNASEVMNLYTKDQNCNEVGGSAAPYAAFTASGKQICKGQNVTFTNQCTNNPSTYQWSFPGGFPSSSTLSNPVVTYPITGIYTISLVATNSFGTSNTAVTTITMGGCSAISESQLDNLSLSPNPSNGKFILKNADSYTYKIFNLSGKLVPYTSHKLTDDSIEIDLSEQSNGIYFLTLSGKDGNVLKSLKLILEK